MPVEFKQSSIKEWIINNLEEGQIADVVLEGCQSGIVSELIYYADSEAGVCYCIDLPSLFYVSQTQNNR